MTNTNFRMEIERNTNGKIEKVAVCKAFYENAKIYGTKEFELWNDFISKNGYAPLVVKKRQKTEKMLAASHKNMTYTNMLTYIKTLENSKKYIEEFNKEKERSKIQNSPYKYMRDWFTKTFPDYKKHETFQDNDETESTENNTPELKVVNN